MRHLLRDMRPGDLILFKSQIGRLVSTLRWQYLAALTLVFEWLPPPFRRWSARILRWRIAAVAREFDVIPRERLRKVVLFISLQPHVREPRVAAAAKLAGWSPVLVYMGKLRPGHEDRFAFRIRVGSVFELMLVSWYFQGAVVHVFALAGHLAWPLIRTKLRPTVVDLYDTCSGMLWTSASGKRAERDAIRRADGMTHRDLRVKYLQRQQGYELPKQNVFVPDLLEQPRVQHPRPNRPREIHVVSTGWIDDKDNSILQTATAFGQAGIYVHAYVNPFQHIGSKSMRAYEHLAATSSYFRLEDPVYGDAYWEHLSRYDFGLSAFEPALTGRRTTNYTPDYLRGCGSSRLADYISAGLGVIVSPMLAYQYAFARRYAGVVVPVTGELLENPRPVIEEALRRREASVRKSIRAITPEGVADRLNKFYTALVSCQP